LQEDVIDNGHGQTGFFVQLHLSELFRVSNEQFQLQAVQHDMGIDFEIYNLCTVIFSSCWFILVSHVVMGGRK
jgi:hypothetical protein